MPKTVATAKTRACAASSHTLPVIRTTAKTTVVISAPKRGPLGSMAILRCPFGDSGGGPPGGRAAWHGPPRDGGTAGLAGGPAECRRGRVAPDLGHRTQRGRDTAVVHGAPPGQG